MSSPALEAQPLSKVYTEPSWPFSSSLWCFFMSKPSRQAHSALKTCDRSLHELPLVSKNYILQPLFHSRGSLIISRSLLFQTSTQAMDVSELQVQESETHVSAISQENDPKLRCSERMLFPAPELQKLSSIWRSDVLKRSQRSAMSPCASADETYGVVRYDDRPVACGRSINTSLADTRNALLPSLQYFRFRKWAMLEIMFTFREFVDIDSHVFAACFSAENEMQGMTSPCMCFGIKICKKHADVNWFLVPNHFWVDFGSPHDQC
jgi:hypothetical protein